MTSELPFLEQEDPEVRAAIRGEERRQADGLELIPSENHASRAVKEALGSVLGDKYAEGYPGARYYGGQAYTDAAERLAQERAKRLFGAAFANVQPLSGAPANMAAYFAFAGPGDAILGMDLSHGGHLTHGHPVTAVANVFRFARYGMKNVETGELDYEALAAAAERERPKIVLAGFSAYPRELDWRRIADIAHGVGAIALADVSHIAGLIAGGAAANPFEAGFDAMTTTTHKTLRGPRGGMILVREDEELAAKVDKAVFPGFQGGPHMNQIAAKAVCFGEALRPSFREYARRVVENARAMAAAFKGAGVRLIAGGTDNHLVLADVYGSLGISGREAERLLDRAGITLNKNLIADDTRRPFDPSGIRFGTPALTTRGFGAAECARVAELMFAVLTEREAALGAVSAEIGELARAHPIPDAFL